MVKVRRPVKQTPSSARKLDHGLSQKVFRTNFAVATTLSTSASARPSQMAYRFKVARATLRRWVIFLVSAICLPSSSNSLPMVVTSRLTPISLLSWSVSRLVAR